jgi:hypothetical protein
VTKEVDRESRRAAESQGGTTITVDAVIPLAISTSPESGPKSSAPLLPSLDDFPTLREILGLLDWESSPEEVDDDDNALSACFGYPQTWKAHLAVLDPHLPPQSLSLPGHKRQPFLDRLYNGERGKSFKFRLGEGRKRLTRFGTLFSDLSRDNVAPSGEWDYINVLSLAYDLTDTD